MTTRMKLALSAAIMAISATACSRMTSESGSRANATKDVSRIQDGTVGYYPQNQAFVTYDYKCDDGYVEVINEKDLLENPANTCKHLQTATAPANPITISQPAGQVDAGNGWSCAFETLPGSSAIRRSTDSCVSRVQKRFQVRYRKNRIKKAIPADGSILAMRYFETDQHIFYSKGGRFNEFSRISLSDPAKAEERFVPSTLSFGIGEIRPLDWPNLFPYYKEIVPLSGEGYLVSNYIMDDSSDKAVTQRGFQLWLYGHSDNGDLEKRLLISSLPFQADPALAGLLEMDLWKQLPDGKVLVTLRKRMDAGFVDDLALLDTDSAKLTMLTASGADRLNMRIFSPTFHSSKAAEGGKSWVIYSTAKAGARDAELFSLQLAPKAKNGALRKPVRWEHEGNPLTVVSISPLALHAEKGLLLAGSRSLYQSGIYNYPQYKEYGANIIAIDLSALEQLKANASEFTPQARRVTHHGYISWDPDNVNALYPSIVSGDYIAYQTTDHQNKALEVWLTHIDDPTRLVRLSGFKQDIGLVDNLIPRSSDPEKGKVMLMQYDHSMIGKSDLRSSPAEGIFLIQDLEFTDRNQGIADSQPGAPSAESPKVPAVTPEETNDERPESGALTVVSIKKAEMIERVSADSQDSERIPIYHVTCSDGLIESVRESDLQDGNFCPHVFKVEYAQNEVLEMARTETASNLPIFMERLEDGLVSVKCYGDLAATVMDSDQWIGYCREKAAANNFQVEGRLARTLSTGRDLVINGSPATPLSDGRAILYDSGNLWLYDPSIKVTATSLAESSAPGSNPRLLHKRFVGGTHSYPASSAVEAGPGVIVYKVDVAGPFAGSSMKPLQSAIWQMSVDEPEKEIKPLLAWDTRDLLESASNNLKPMVKLEDGSVVIKVAGMQRDKANQPPLLREHLYILQSAPEGGASINSATRPNECAQVLKQGSPVYLCSIDYRLDELKRHTDGYVVINDIIALRQSDLSGNLVYSQRKAAIDGATNRFVWEQPELRMIDPSTREETVLASQFEHAAGSAPGTITKPVSSRHPLELSDGSLVYVSNRSASSLDGSFVNPASTADNLWKLHPATPEVKEQLTAFQSGFDVLPRRVERPYLLNIDGKDWIGYEVSSLVTVRLGMLWLLNPQNPVENIKITSQHATHYNGNYKFLATWGGSRALVSSNIGQSVSTADLQASSLPAYDLFLLDISDLIDSSLGEK